MENRIKSTGGINLKDLGLKRGLRRFYGGRRSKEQGDAWIIGERDRRGGGVESRTRASKS